MQSNCSLICILIFLCIPFFNYIGAEIGLSDFQLSELPLTS